MARATRPIFTQNDTTLVNENFIEFEWFMGTTLAQKQKNIMSLHEQAKVEGYMKVLEISTYSPLSLGVRLSAFNLKLKAQNGLWPVEKLYQMSKKLHDKNIEPTDKGRKGSQPYSFVFEGYEWPLDPQSCFYDWLYINALLQDNSLSNSVLEFHHFSDIAYNPKKSLSTQARSAALYVTLVRNGLIEKIKRPDDFIALLKGYNYMPAAKTLFS